VKICTRKELRMKNVVTRFFRDECGVTRHRIWLDCRADLGRAAMTFAGQQLLGVYNRIGNALAAAL
jgi:hypothetical protein